MGDITIRSVHDLAAALRGGRQDLGLTQVEVARRIGVSRKWVSDLETGRAVADAPTLLRLLEVLGFELQLKSASSNRDDAKRTKTTDLDALLSDYLGS